MMAPSEGQHRSAAIESELEELFVRRAMGTATPADLVGWATAALVAGWDARDLATLAGLPTPYDRVLAERLFHAVLVDMDRAEPPANEVLSARARLLAESVLDGRLSAAVVAARMHDEVVEPLGHPVALIPWCYLGLGMTVPEEEPATGPDGIATAVQRHASVLLTALAEGPLDHWNGPPPVTPHDASVLTEGLPSPSARLAPPYRMAAGLLALLCLAGAVVLIRRGLAGWAGWVGMALCLVLALAFGVAAGTGRNFDWQPPPAAPEQADPAAE